MGYFDRTGMPPAIPVPVGVRLWETEATPTLVWRRPLASCDGYVVLGGATPESLAELARLPASATRWPVPTTGDPWLAVACVRGGVLGELCVPVLVANLMQPEAAQALGSVGGNAPQVFHHEAHEAHEGRIASAPYPASTIAQADGDAHQAGLCCQCCTPPRVLTPADGTLACPHTGELYAAMATGGLARATELPFGLCRCCEARQPLMRCGETVVCLAQPDQVYIRAGGVYLPRPPDEAQIILTDAAAIDAALRANSALLGVNGVFVVEGTNQWTR